MSNNAQKTINILLVDDDSDIGMTFKIGLEKMGFTVDVYTNPVLALSEYKLNYYSFLLLDIRMPEMTGFELYYKITKIDRGAKACFITAFETYYESLKDSYPSLDVDCFIKKPISIEDLVHRIKTKINQE